MSPGATVADRNREVRTAARGWQRAGAIDEPTRRTIDASFPDDRSRLGPVFRTLAFVFTFIAIGALFLLCAVVIRHEESVRVLAFLFGASLWALTEVQLGPLRRSDGGTETATGLLAIAFLVGGLGFTLDGSGLPWGRVVACVLLCGVLLFAIAAVRWGGAFWAAGATVSLFLLVAQAPLGRFGWIALGLGVLWPLLVLGDSENLPPIHRRACQASLGLALIGLYVALHLGSFDHRFVESLRASGTGNVETAPLRVLAILGTALIPLVLLAVGFQTRRLLLLNLGAVLGIASLVTLRFYFHLAPPGVVLAVGGASAVGIALVLHRLLDSGLGKERRGFTAEPLFEDPSKRTALEVLAAAAALGPKARPLPTPEFRGGGGQSGGGGATDSF